MPWGWECRSRLIKQLPAKPTQNRKKNEIKSPGPMQHHVPEIIGGKGYSHIKRAPAFTFGHLTPVDLKKPVTTSNARMFNVSGFSNKGPYRITHSVVGSHLEPVGFRGKIPGPGAHEPRFAIQHKRPPAYSLRPPARPPYQAWDQWTPPPNMYCPPIPGKKPPAFTLGNMPRDMKPQQLPGPGEHEPNFKYVVRKPRDVSFAGPFKPPRPPKTPAPNAYCEKKFMVHKRSIPAPSFGIRHSQYLGQFETYLKSSKTDLTQSP